MNAYIVAAKRSAVGKSKRGLFRFVRPDDLATEVIKGLLAEVPSLDKESIDDVIVGNATPEAEQGLNVGRMISLMSLDTDKVPGMTVNRYCASGLETISIAAAKIHAGLADCIIAGGVESMSSMPMGGWRIVPNSEISEKTPDWYWGMGLTAEAVAKDYKVAREDQDAFALRSHQRAVAAIDGHGFEGEIVPIEVEQTFLDSSGRPATKKWMAEVDEGARRDTNPEALARLKPVFDAKGSVTAGNSSQTSDGAAFVMVVSEKKLKELGVEPLAQMKAYAAMGVPPRIMGIGPIKAVPKALELAGMNLSDMDVIELNEAFASQSLAVIRELEMDPDKVNPNGGAIALGHPLGCTGAKLTTQLIYELKRRKQKYGMVTMCVGSGQGAAGIFEIM
jgi:acetyl-CoA acyltransferase